MRCAYLLVLTSLACGTEASRTRPAAPATAPVAVPEPRADIEAESGNRPEPAVSWLNPDIDPPELFPLRAMIRRAGAIYEGRTGPVLAVGDGRSMSITAIAIESDAGGSPRRPRILCEHSSHRVAVYLDASDLGVVARAGAIISPARKRTAAPSPETPGVHLAAGALLEPLDPAPGPGPRRVRYRGLFMVAEGWLAADEIDVVYRPAPLPEERYIDGELIESVQLLDAPGGREVARITRIPAYVNRLMVHKLAEPRAGAILIRYREHDAAAVGWVPSRAVKNVEPESYVTSSMIGIGSGTTRAPTVTLVRGTQLVSPTDGAVLGVITRDNSFVCLSSCDADPPTVSVYACSASVGLLARPPSVE